MNRGGKEIRREVLEAALDEAAKGGPMSFETFMDLVLYHPEGGFYTRPEMRVGTGGDFHTSPTIHPAFGTCVARQIAQFWVLLGKPTELPILELGAGSGQLADQVLTELDRLQLSWRTVRYHILERSPALRDRQHSLLSHHPVTWVDSLDALAPPGTWRGIVLSNELFDALPVRRVLMSDQGLAEIGVMRGTNGRWRQVGITLTEPRLETYLAEAGITLQPSQQAEINLRAVDLMEAIASWLGSGFVLTIDYGGPAEKVYALHRKKGTIRGYYRQLPVDDPMLHPGEQDLTSDVDFSALIRAGDRHALTTLGLLPQGQFLVNLGIQDLEKEAAKGIKSELEADYATSGIRKLYHPAAMGGGFQVLLQAKGVTVTPDRIAGLGGAPIPRRAGIWNPFRRAR